MGLLDLLSLASAIIAIVSLPLAILQFVRSRDVKAVVRDWGSDICKNLEEAEEGLTRKHDEIEALNPPEWNQSRPQMEGYLRDRAQQLQAISRSTQALLRNVTGK